MEETTNRRPSSRRRRAAQRRRTHNVILVFVFILVVIIFFLLNVCTKDKTYSETENRNLAQRPTLSLTALADGSLFSDITDWYNDQFVGRDRWMALNLSEMKLLGRKESGGVYLGEDNYLLSAPETPDEESLEKTIDAVNQFADRYPDITMQMMLVPDAATILSDYLPKNAPVRDQLADIEAVRSGLSGAVSMIDVSGALSAHADEGIYYRTDHHWTSLGAWYAFQASAARLGITNPETYTVYTVTDDFEGTLASKSGSHAVRDSIQIYTAEDSDIYYYVIRSGSTDRISSIYDSSCLEAKDKYTVFFGGNYGTVEICTTADNGRNLLVLKDSYANSFIQFLLPYYENIIMVDARYYYDSLDSILSGYSITDVLYLYSADTFLTDTSLADVLNAESGQAAAETEDFADFTETENPEENSAEPESSAVEELTQDTEEPDGADSAAEEEESYEEASSPEPEDSSEETQTDPDALTITEEEVWLE